MPLNVAGILLDITNGSNQDITLYRIPVYDIVNKVMAGRADDSLNLTHPD